MRFICSTLGGFPGMMGSGVSATLRQEEMPKMGTSHSGVLHGFLCWGTQKNTSMDQPTAFRACRPASTLKRVVKKV
jgi:hypothetical protein